MLNKIRIASVKCMYIILYSVNMLFLHAVKTSLGESVVRLKVRLE